MLLLFTLFQNGAMNLQVSKKDYIEIWTLNRPDALNSISRALLSELEENINRLYRENTRVMLLTGNGRSFCTGADLKERSTMSTVEVKDFLLRTGDLFQKLEQLPTITIAAINGFALGGGLEMALCFDIRLAASSALLGLPETSLGIIPGAGGTQRLPRTIGVAAAKEWIFTAEKYSADKALQDGAVHYVIEDSQLQTEAMKMAETIASRAPVALAQAKFAINRGMETGLDSALALERKAYEITIPTEDRTEALKAFKEKRKPVFQGK